MAYGERQDVYLHERRDCGCGGGWNERTARLELGNILARVKAGMWRRCERPAGDATPPRPHEAPTFGDYAPDWLQAKRDGVFGERSLDDNTYADYRWRLGHLLAFFAPCRLDEIDGELCLAFKAHKLREAQELRQVIAAGAAIRDRYGRRARPLGASSIKKLIYTLVAILDEAIEDGHIDSNPARVRRMRIHVPKPKRGFLEIDELASVEDAAGAPEAQLAERAVVAADVARPGSTRARVAARLAAGMRPDEIAADLGLARSTVGHFDLRPSRFRWCASATTRRARRREGLRHARGALRPGLQRPARSGRTVPSPERHGGLGRVATVLRATPGIVSVSTPQGSPGGRAAVYQAFPRSSPEAQATTDLVKTLRNEVLPPVAQKSDAPSSWAARARAASTSRTSWQASFRCASPWSSASGRCCSSSSCSAPS